MINHIKNNKLQLFIYKITKKQPYLLSKNLKNIYFSKN